MILSQGALGCPDSFKSAPGCHAISTVKCANQIHRDFKWESIVLNTFRPVVRVGLSARRSGKVILGKNG